MTLPGINTVWFGSSTLASILDGAGQGEVNVITTIKTNGVALAVDAERAVDIIIPSAGEGNIIEGITVNGASVSPDANKIVALTIPDAGQSNVIEGVTVNGTALTPDANKVVAITIPDAGQSNVIETVKVNGSALTPDSDKAVDITIPTIDGKLDARVQLRHKWYCPFEGCFHCDKWHSREHFHDIHKTSHDKCSSIGCD